MKLIAVITIVGIFAMGASIALAQQQLPTAMQPGMQPSQAAGDLTKNSGANKGGAINTPAFNAATQPGMQPSQAAGDLTKNSLGKKGAINTPGFNPATQPGMQPSQAAGDLTKNSAQNPK